MRIRHDAVFVSSLLFSLSLILLIPHNLRYALTWHHRLFQQADRLWVENHFAPIGFASLALVSVGLIVIWAGYVNRVRWTWFVMFVIVWGFAFPVHVLPVLLDMHEGLIDWRVLSEQLKVPGEVARSYAMGPADFVLMLVALVIPIKSLFGGQSVGQSDGGSE
jgi:hypothetical protein